MRRADDFHKHAPTKIEQDIALERANKQSESQEKN